jgi:hypothetical protein
MGSRFTFDTFPSFTSTYQATGFAKQKKTYDGTPCTDIDVDMKRQILPQHVAVKSVLVTWLDVLEVPSREESYELCATKLNGRTRGLVLTEIPRKNRHSHKLTKSSQSRSQHQSDRFSWLPVDETAFCGFCPLHSLIWTHLVSFLNRRTSRKAKDFRAYCLPYLATLP